jgi:hypothetical protein
MIFYTLGLASVQATPAHEHWYPLLPSNPQTSINLPQNVLKGRIQTESNAAFCQHVSYSSSF